MDLGRLPPLSALRSFEAAARLGSFSAAARELNVTHAAIAQQVRRLEAWLGVRLIERAGRGVAPTGRGEELAAGLGEGFGAIARAVGRVMRDDEARPLRITVTPTFAVAWLMPRLGGFRAAHPGIEVMVNPTTDLIDVIADEYDVAFRYGRGEWRGLDAEPVLASDMVIVAERGLLARHPVETPADLLDVPWVQELGTEEIRTWFATHGIEWGSNRNILNLPGHLAIEALRQGEGFGLTARAWMAADIASGRVVSLFEAEQDPELGYYMAYPPEPHRGALKRFLAWARREMAKDAAGASGRREGD